MSLSVTKIAQYSKCRQIYDLKCPPCLLSWANGGRVSYSSLFDVIAFLPIARPGLLTSYSSFYPVDNAGSQVGFIISSLRACNVQTEKSRGLSLTNNKFGKHT